MIIALAGRRVDAPDAETPRFPLDQVDTVRSRIRQALEAEKPEALVSSAACGADLLGLAVAGEMGIRRRVVLPYERPRFRDSSVIDRPGDWGTLFDRMVDEVEAAGDLVLLSGLSDDEAYAAVNRKILDEAQALGSEVTAFIVWDGESRGSSDLTEAFANEARSRGITVLPILTR